VIDSIVRPFNDKYKNEYKTASCTHPTPACTGAACITPVSSIVTKSQQNFVKEYINLHTPFKGLVLWHGLGSGKTLSAISIAEQFISDVEHDLDHGAPKQKYSILFISPAMLVSNFETEIEKYDEFYKDTSMYGNDSDPGNYTSFTSNGKLTTYQRSNRDLFKNKVIIIDESQILIRTITSAIENRANSSIFQAYTDMMQDESSKVVCLSGTPIDKSPLELGVLFNLLAGQRYVYNVNLPLATVLQTVDSADKALYDAIDKYESINHGTSCIIHRIPMYFRQTTEPYANYTYTSTGNGYSSDEFMSELKRALPTATVIRNRTDPLFNLDTFMSQYALPPRGQPALYRYNVMTDTTDIRDHDIQSGRTHRTDVISHADEFKDKVSGYMSFFGNIQKILPNVRILPAANTNRSSDEYRIGHDNNGNPLFVVQRCEFSPYQQEMVELFNSDLFQRSFVKDTYGFMARNCEHFVYPFENNVNIFRENYLRNVPIRIIQSVRKFYKDNKQGIRAGKYGPGITNPRILLTRMKYVYGIRSSVSDTTYLTLESYGQIQGRKHNSIVANMQSDDQHHILRGGATRKYRHTQGSVYDLREIADDGNTRRLATLVSWDTIEQIYTAYSNILTDIVLCTFPIRSIWTPATNPSFSTRHCEPLETGRLSTGDQELSHVVIDTHYAPNHDPVKYYEHHLDQPSGNLANYSSKLDKIVGTILANPHSCHIIYSQYKQVNIPISRALMANGYEQFKIRQSTNKHGNILLDTYDHTKKHFMYITGSGGPDDVEVDSQFYRHLWGHNYDEGQLDPKLKQHYINIFNGDVKDSKYDTIKQHFANKAWKTGEWNSTGDICNVVILNSAAAEGITLKTVRYVHLLHPPASMAKIYQIIGRAIRNCTHEQLTTQADRDVTAIMYLSKNRQSSTRPVAQVDLADVRANTQPIYITGDEKKYNECVNTADRYVPYLNLLKGTAVDCTLNQQIEDDTGTRIYPNLTCTIK
jgi:hypothetical protein